MREKREGREEKEGLNEKGGNELHARRTTIDVTFVKSKYIYFLFKVLLHTLMRKAYTTERGEIVF